ncbi:urate hydroxylase PuuD [Vibrio sp. M60_M31a]
MELTSLQAVGIGVGGILLGVVVYEALMRSPLSRNTALFSAALLAFGALFFYGFTQLFSGRGAFIHMGALIGSIMVNNVFHKIVSRQRKMVAQVNAGETVDPAPGLEGKRRSIHNNYFTLPVIFLMISNHYPMIYQHPLNWLIGFFVMIISAYIRHYFNLVHIGQNRPRRSVKWSLCHDGSGVSELAVYFSQRDTQPTVANADSPACSNSD